VRRFDWMVESAMYVLGGIMAVVMGTMVICALGLIAWGFLARG